MPCCQYIPPLNRWLWLQWQHVCLFQDSYWHSMTNTYLYLIYDSWLHTMKLKHVLLSIPWYSNAINITCKNPIHTTWMHNCMYNKCMHHVSAIVPTCYMYTYQLEYNSKLLLKNLIVTYYTDLFTSHKLHHFLYQRSPLHNQHAFPPAYLLHKLWLLKS